MKRRSNEAGLPIYFVGAGPGDPELITVKGRRLLDEADLVVYAGSLVNPELLKGLRARLLDSSKMDLDRIVAVMEEAWRRDELVVRLHTGDPSIFGAIKEQMARLADLGIPFEVVPGVSSALASAAAIPAELTEPEVSQTVIFTRRAGRTPVPEGEEIEGLAAHRATMCIFLSVSMMEELTLELLEGGYQPDTPVVVVEKATWPDERLVRGTLEDIAEKVKEAGIEKTAMILVGEALAPPDTSRPRSKLYDRTFTHGCRQGDGDGGKMQ